MNKSEIKDEIARIASEELAKVKVKTDKKGVYRPLNKEEKGKSIYWSTRIAELMQMLETA